MKAKNSIPNLLTYFRKRIYGLKNLRSHIFAELLENRYIQGLPISNKSLEIVNKFLNSGSVNDSEIDRDCDGINFDDELIRRISHESIFSFKKKPEKIVHIIGSPRSGSTHLYYLLCSIGCFAYFTSVSHFLWSHYNASIERYRGNIFDNSMDFFMMDHSLLWGLSKEITPADSQSIFNHAIKVQDYVGNKTFKLHDTQIINSENLSDAINKQTALMSKQYFLSKDLFNTFRIDELTMIYPSATYFIHIFRDGYRTTESINFHDFKVDIDGRLISGKELWKYHINRIISSSKGSKILTVNYDKLIYETEKTIENIFKFLDIKMRIQLPVKTQMVDRRAGGSGDSEIDEINKRFIASQDKYN